jgi:serine/threonine protein kinase
MNNYKILETYLYKSFISDIYKVEDTNGAIKCIKKIPVYQKTAEIEILKCISHPNIVKYYSHFDIGDGRELCSYTCLVQEFIIGNTLTELRLTNRLSHNKINIIILQLCSVLEYIHAHKIIHLDICPSNIIITDTDFILKLIDFGLSKYMRNDVNTDTSFMEGFGKQTHYPIELLQKGMYGEFTDIWGIGIILYFLITGNNPFNSTSQIKNKLYIPIILKDSPYKNILIKILTLDYNNRPTIIEIKTYIEEYQNKLDELI